MLHPDHLSARLSAPQLRDWAEYFAREPWGTPADDLRSGVAAAALATVAGRAKRPFRPAAFMPSYAHPPSGASDGRPSHAAGAAHGELSGPAGQEGEIGEAEIEAAFAAAGVAQVPGAGPGTGH